MLWHCLNYIHFSDPFLVYDLLFNPAHYVHSIWFYSKYKAEIDTDWGLGAFISFTFYIYVYFTNSFT